MLFKVSKHQSNEKNHQEKDRYICPNIIKAFKKVIENFALKSHKVCKVCVCGYVCVYIILIKVSKI